jgi:type II secretion system protein J
MPHAKCCIPPCRHHDMKSPSLQHPAGFTLIELLLALAMFAIIAGVIFASFAAVVDGVDKGRQSADVYRVGRGAMQRLTQEISTAIWFENDERTALLGENGEVNEHPHDRLSFVTIPYRRFNDKVPEGELCDVSYFLEENAQGKVALFRSEDCTLDDDRQAGGTKLELTDLAVGLDITYFDADGDHDSWPPNGGTNKGLPCYIRVVITLQDAQQYERVFITTVPLLMRDECGEQATQ